MPSQPVELQQSIPFGEDFEFDLRPRRLRRRGHVLKLERIPLEILLLLLEHPGQLVTRDAIVARIWGKEAFLDTDNSIRSAIRKIRQVLRDDPDQPMFIQTVTGQGYRFIAPIASRATEEIQPAIPIPGILIQEDNQREAATPPAVAAPAPAVPRPGDLRPYRWMLLCLAAIVVLAIGYVLFKNRQTGVVAPNIRSIAVLPLKNLSGDSAQDYFAEGMTEEVIGRLASIHGLRVISRTSVMRFKDSTTTVPEIGRTLGVDAIVEGSVIREDNRVRVHSQLIRAATDEHFWSETYDREMGDVLSLESDIAQSIAEKVKVTVTGQEHALLGAARPVSPEVYESYLKGMFADHNKASPSSRLPSTKTRPLHPRISGWPAPTRTWAPSTAALSPARLAPS